MESIKAKKSIVVVVAVVKKDNKILMVQRNEEINPGAHLLWEFPGGKVEFGETLEEALVREVKEETGFVAKIIDQRPAIWTKMWEYPDFLQHTVVLAFHCAADGGQEPTQDVKVKEIAWKGLDEIDYSKVLPGTKEILEQLKNA